MKRGIGVKRAMWVLMGVLALVVAYLTFTSPHWSVVSLLQALLAR